MPGSARRNPSAQRREFPGLKEETQCQSSGFELPLEVGTEYPRLDARCLGLPVNLEYTTKTLEINGHCPPIGFIVRRVYTADNTGAAAIRDRRDAVFRTPIEQRFNVSLITRIGDKIRGIGEIVCRCIIRARSWTDRR